MHRPASTLVATAAATNVNSLYYTRQVTANNTNEYDQKPSQIASDAGGGGFLAEVSDSTEQRIDEMNHIHHQHMSSLDQHSIATTGG